MLTPEEYFRRSEDFYRRLHQRPFQPFAVHLQDGRVYEVRYPDINLVGTTFLGIGIPVPNMDDPLCQNVIMVPLDFITRVEPLPTPVPSATP